MYNSKKRGLIYICIGTVLFVIGLALIYGDMIGFGAVLINFSGGFTTPGFMMLFE